MRPQISYAEALAEKIPEMDTSEVRRIAIALADEADRWYEALQYAKGVIYITWMLIIIWGLV